MSSRATVVLDPAIEALIRELPKAELHVHLEGSLPPHVALTLAERSGVSLPGAEAGVEGRKARYRYSDFQAFIRLYLAISSCLARARDFSFAVTEVARELARENVRYVEMTFTPMTHVARGVDIDGMLAGLGEGRARAREQHGVVIAWVFDIVRTLPDRAEATLEIALRRDDIGVIGLGFSGPEGQPHDIDAFAPLFARARGLGLVSLPHAGEMAGPVSIHKALDALGARRIGHGVRCLEDPVLVRRLREARIPLEVCPTSNVVLGVVPSLDAHPLPRLLDAGLAVSLASDDPALFGTTLNDEFRRCAAAFAWGAPRILSLAAAAVEHSCMQEADKHALLAAQTEQARALGVDTISPTPA